MSNYGDTLHNYLIPKKHLGQNYLSDLRVQQKIVDACDFNVDDTLVEIGPGQGAITRLLAPMVRRLICVETDRDLIVPLEEEFKGTNVEIVHADFLKWDLPSKVKVIGNIPYNISTPIIEKLIENRSSIHSAYLTVQLEFGQRLAAPAGNKTYGALSCFAQYHADTKVLFKIKNSCFKPVPKVDSCFVRMDFNRQPIYHPKDEQLFFNLIRTAFTQRRKNILNAMNSLVEKERLISILTQLKIPPTSRAEGLNLADFVAISDQIS